MENWTISTVDAVLEMSSSAAFQIDPGFPHIADSIYFPRFKGERVPNCLCQLKAEKKSATAETKNKGRYYFACVQKAPCRYFRWADTLEPYAAILNTCKWHLFLDFKLLESSAFDPKHIIQGKVGDCWFLSALAVVCERPDRIQRIINPRQSGGRPILISLFIDGSWRDVFIDRYFPVLQDGTFVFSQPLQSQLWVCAVEKAYAKAYGSYSSISGGEVAEALFDLTGCPVETVELCGLLENPEIADFLWTRLLSFKESKFLIGCGTNFSANEGVAAFHAYSVLDVIELHNVVVGKQRTLRQCFAETRLNEERQTVRLLKIRNPWGKFEWKGKWSSLCENWTTSLSQKLGRTEKNDGVFFIEYTDFLQKFSVLDICKTHEGFFEQSHSVITESAHSTVFDLRVLDHTWLYLIAVQPSIRNIRNPSRCYKDLGIFLTNESQEELPYILNACKRVQILDCVLAPGDYKISLESFSNYLKYTVKVFSANPVLLKRAMSRIEMNFPSPEKVLSSQIPLLAKTSATSNLFLISLSYGGIFYLIVEEKVPADDFIPLHLSVVFTEKAIRVVRLRDYCSQGKEQRFLLGVILQQKNGIPDFEIILSPLEIQSFKKLRCSE